MMNISPAMAALLVLAGWHTQSAAQQAYPQKPIRIISPFAAGGGNDAFLRTLAHQRQGIQRPGERRRHGGRWLERDARSINAAWP